MVLAEAGGTALVKDRSRAAETQERALRDMRSLAGRPPHEAAGYGRQFGAAVGVVGS